MLPVQRMPSAIGEGLVEMQECLTLIPVSHQVVGEGVVSSHWGQRVVYQPGTLQIHCKDMDKVPTIYQPGHWGYIYNFPSQFLCSFPDPGNAQYIHSVPSNVTAVS